MSGCSSLASLRYAFLISSWLASRETPSTSYGSFMRSSSHLVRRRAASIEPQHRGDAPKDETAMRRSEEHTSELQSLMRISYAVFCLNKKTEKKHNTDRSRH